MRTTITIDDVVYRKAKARAAETSQSVSQLIEDAVRAALQKQAAVQDDLPPLPSHGRGGLRPGVDLEDRSALLDLMDEGTPLDALR